MTNPILDIPKAFSDAFIAAANDATSDPDPLDLGVSGDRGKLHLSNNHPGYSPYLQLTRSSAGQVAAEICSRTNGRMGDEQRRDTVSVEATVDVDLADPVAATRKALDCWLATL